MERNQKSTRKQHITYLRILCALLVCYAHSKVLLGQEIATRWSGISIPNIAVDAFFVLSGFLLWNKALTNNPIQFVVNRIARILPGLVVSVLVTAFSLSLYVFLGNEAKSPRFRDIFSWIYTNIDVLNPNRMFSSRFFFTNNPHTSSINGSLWTITFEFWSYLFLILFTSCTLIFTKFLSESIANLIRICLLSALSLFLILGADFSETSSVNYFFHHLLVCLLLGCLFSALSNQFHALFLLISKPAVTFSIICLLFPLFIWAINNQEYNKTGIVLFSLIISLIANLKFQKGIVGPVKNVDPSYGIYLYSFPINQALIAAGITEWIVCLFLTASISIVAGVLSYKLVEEKFIGAFVYRNQSANSIMLPKKNQFSQ